MNTSFLSSKHMPTNPTHYLSHQNIDIQMCTPVMILYDRRGESRGFYIIIKPIYNLCNPHTISGLHTYLFSDSRRCSYIFSPNILQLIPIYCSLRICTYKMLFQTNIPFHTIFCCGHRYCICSLPFIYLLIIYHITYQ